MLENLDSEVIAEATRLRLANDFEGAISLLLTHVQSNPKDIRALYYLGLSYIDQGLHSKALKVLSQVVEEEPDYLATLLDRVECLVGLGRGPEALDTLQSAQELYDAIPDAEKSSGEYRLITGKLRRTGWRAFRYMGYHNQALIVAMAHAQESPRGVRDVEQSLIDLKRYDEAERFRGDQPQTRATSLWGIALKLCEEKKYNEALPFFLTRLSLARLPQDSQFLFGYLECLLLAEQYDRLQMTAFYWMQTGAIHSKPVLRYLELLRAMASDRLNPSSGLEVTRCLKGECLNITAKQCFRLFSRQTTLSPMYDTVEQLVNEFYRTK